MNPMDDSNTRRAEAGGSRPALLLALGLTAACGSDAERLNVLLIPLETTRADRMS